MEENKKQYLTVDEMSKCLNIGITNSYKMAKDPAFYPAKKICGRYVISVELLHQWIKEQGK